MINFSIVKLSIFTSFEIYSVARAKEDVIQRGIERKKEEKEGCTAALL